MNANDNSYCIKCGKSSSYDAQGACKKCGGIIAFPCKKSPSRGYEPRPHVTTKPNRVIPSDGFDTIIVGLYVGACVTFLLGVFLPFITILKQVTIFGVSVFSEKNTVSMMSGIWALMKEGQWLLFFVLLLFSIIFPVLKLAILYLICCDRGEEPKVKKQLKFLALTGKWSMLDVVVIGILVVTLKLGDMVEVKIHSGIYFFTASVLITMAISSVAGVKNPPGLN